MEGVSAGVCIYTDRGQYRADPDSGGKRNVYSISDILRHYLRRAQRAGGAQDRKK